MKLLDALERRLGRFAIPGLTRIVVAFTALVYVITTFVNSQFLSILELDPERIRHGEIWRLITYIFIPRSIGPPSAFQPLWVLLVLWFVWFIGEALERAFGPFRLTLYFFLGMIGTTIAAFFFGAQFSNEMLVASLFFAFAHFYPDQVLYLFMILPVKVKWLAWISAALLLYGFAVGSNAYRMSLLAAFANYFIFFGPELVRSARNRQQVSNRRRRFAESGRSQEEALHRCATCGATELTHPNLDFRVARDGEEYCLAHLPSAAKVEA